MKRDQEATNISGDSSNTKSDRQPLDMAGSISPNCRQCRKRISQYLAKKLEQKIEKSASAFLARMSNQKGFDQKEFYNFNLF